MNKLLIILTVVFSFQISSASTGTPGEAPTPDHTVPPVKLVHLQLPGYVFTPEQSVPPETRVQLKIPGTPRTITPAVPPETLASVFDGWKRNPQSPDSFTPPPKANRPEQEEFEVAVDPLGVGPAKDYWTDWTVLTQIVLSSDFEIAFVSEDGKDQIDGTDIVLGYAEALMNADQDQKAILIENIQMSEILKAVAAELKTANL